MKLNGLLAVGIAVTTVMSACGAGSPGSTATQSSGPGTIVIGNVESMTGTLAAYGISNTRGAEVAIGEINAAGGVTVGGTRYNLQLKTADDQAKPEVGVAETKQLLAQGIKFIVGPALSTVSIALEPLWGTSDAVFIVAGGSEPALTDGRPNVFSTAFRHTDLAKATVWFFRVHEKGYTKAAVISDATSVTLGTIFNQTFQTEWKAQGGTIGAVVTSQGQTTTDFYPQLTAILESKPDFVASAQTIQPNANSIKQARQLGLNVPFISTAGGAPQEADIAGDAINGNYETAGLNLDSLISQGNADAKTLADLYQKKYSEPLSDLVGTFSNMYTAVYALASAIKAAGTTTDASAVKAQMYKVMVSSLPPIVAAKYGAQSSGTLFDSTGWAHLKTAILVWKDKKLTLAAISP